MDASWPSSLQVVNVLLNGGYGGNVDCCQRFTPLCFVFTLLLPSSCAFLAFLGSFAVQIEAQALQNHFTALTSLDVAQNSYQCEYSHCGLCAHLECFILSWWLGVGSLFLYFVVLLQTSMALPITPLLSLP